jgi:hypothetical protein
VTSPFLAPARDPSYKMGRAKATGGTVYLSIPGCPVVSTSTASPGNGQDNYGAWFASTPLIIDQLSAEVTTGGGTNFRMGFYAADANWQPVGAPLADSGSLDSVTPAVKTYTPASPIYVPPGRYVSVINADSGTTAFRVFRVAMETAFGTALGSSPFLAAMTVSRAHAAFPTPGTAWTSVTTSTVPLLHYIAYRVTAP